jgi:AcrR family transcriptional regulator
MKPRALDRRVTRTHRLLRDALVGLVLERGWERVTVRDVCAQADVGRSTFYVHFADKEELLLLGFQRLREHLVGLQGSHQGAFAFTDELVAHAADNQRLFRALLGKKSAAAVQRRFREVVIELVEADLEFLQVPVQRRPLVARYLAGGFVEMLLHWLDHPTRIKRESVAREFLELSRAAVGAHCKGARSFDLTQC